MLIMEKLTSRRKKISNTIMYKTKCFIGLKCKDACFSTVACDYKIHTMCSILPLSGIIFLCSITNKTFTVLHNV